MFNYQSDKFARGVRGSEIILNHIEMHRQKYHNWEIWLKKHRNSNTLMVHKTFYWKVVLHKVLEITIKNREKAWQRRRKEFLYILGDSWSVA